MVKNTLLSLLGTGLAALGVSSLLADDGATTTVGSTGWSSLDALGLRPGVLDAVQTESARVIADYANRVVGSNPLAWRAFARGLIANAYAESELRPDAIGDTGASFGLFQLYTKGGEGEVALSKGWTRESLLTATGNASYFVPYAWSLSRVRTPALAGDVEGTTRAITIYAERPKYSASKAEARVALLYSLFAG